MKNMYDVLSVVAEIITKVTEIIFFLIIYLKKMFLYEKKKTVQLLSPVKKFVTITKNVKKL